MKKIFPVFMALLLIASMLFAACTGGANESGKESQSQEQSSSTEENQGGEKKVITIGVCQNVSVEDYDTNALTRYIEEVTGYDIQFQFFSSRADDAKTQISTRVAGGEKLPDIIMSVPLGSSVYTQYGREGYFLDLAEFFEDEEKSANFWNMLHDSFSEAEQDNITRQMEDQETGAIYALPLLETSIVDTMDFQPYINKVWLDKLGLQMPTSTQELYDVLVAFRDGDPNGNGRKDEIPLCGAETLLGGRVVEWILNMFMYYNRNRSWNVDENGQLYLTAATPEYREGLIFINKLVKENLLSQSSFTPTTAGMKGITTPADGVAICGIFVGHLSLHVEVGNDVLHEYIPMDFWGNVIRNDNKVQFTTFITKDCADPSAAFDFLMRFYSTDVARRGRYGEYGVDWVDADPGTTSYVGYPAAIKVLNDGAFGGATNSTWNSVPPTILVNSEHEDSQFDDTLDEWQYYKKEIFSGLIQNFERKEKETVDISSGTLVYTEEEKETTSTLRSNLTNYIANQRTDFMVGKQDVSNDNVWNAYITELNRLGFETWRSQAQAVYDRQNR